MIALLFKLEVSVTLSRAVKMMALSPKMCIIYFIDAKVFPVAFTVIEYGVKYKVHKEVLRKLATSMPPVSTVSFIEFRRI